VIDFELPHALINLRERVESFIANKIVPYENDPRQTSHGPSESLRRELVELTRQAGLLSPHGPKEFGGLGLDHRSMAVVFEAAGWSTLGPLALNIQAPDEGNVNLLNQIATPEQKVRWLAPLVRGEIRSIFSMTETVTDGAGSDPSLLQTTARRVPDGFVIDGRKWMITGVPDGEHQYCHGAYPRRDRSRSGRDNVSGRRGRAGLSRGAHVGHDRH
jgi:acyl-CoA dehydrogenase